MVGGPVCRSVVMKSFTIIRRRKKKNKEGAEDAANKRRRRPAIGQEIIILCSGKGEEKRRVSLVFRENDVL